MSCSNCSQAYNFSVHSPRQLDCDHFICQKCAFSQQQVTCVVCQKVTQKDFLNLPIPFLPGDNVYKTVLLDIIRTQSQSQQQSLNLFLQHLQFNKIVEHFNHLSNPQGTAVQLQLDSQQEYINFVNSRFEKEDAEVLTNLFFSHDKNVVSAWKLFKQFNDEEDLQDTLAVLLKAHQKFDYGLILTELQKYISTDLIRFLKIELDQQNELIEFFLEESFKKGLSESGLQEIKQEASLCGLSQYCESLDPKYSQVLLQLCCKQPSVLKGAWEAFLLTKDEEELKETLEMIADQTDISSLEKAVDYQQVLQTIQSQKMLENTQIQLLKQEVDQQNDIVMHLLQKAQQQQFSSQVIKELKEAADFSGISHYCSKLGAKHSVTLIEQCKNSPQLFKNVWMNFLINHDEEELQKNLLSIAQSQ